MLGYYLRSVTAGDATVLRISIRRFRCSQCRKTVSMLPAFAQPYRLVHNATVNAYFGGCRKAVEIIPWSALLRRYWKRFAWWVPQLEGVVRSRLGHPSDPRVPERYWAALLMAFGDVIVTTKLLVSEFRVTLFGRYRCHAPNTGKTLATY